MEREDHITSETLAAVLAGELVGEHAQSVEAHIASCESCAATLAQARAFVQDLDESWNRERLRGMNVAHPSGAEIEALWMDEADGYDLAAIRRHVDSCSLCARHLQRLEDGFAAIIAADPLSQPGWSSVVRGKFAAGIEMAVEAATGAYTSAAGMVRDVMTPQAHVRLAPASVVAMNGETTAPANEGALWHDATFTTDEVSGEITGSTDPTTGRGIITVVVHKSGGFVAMPPMVDLVNEKGKVISTQSGLDMGDRYTAYFQNLDQGRYLIGVREPGT